MCLSNGEITYISDNARELLARWFAIRDTRITRLPAALRSLLVTASQVPRRAEFSRFGKLLAIACFPFEQQLCFCLSESIDPLQQSGLTPREMEVLEWLAEGKRNDEIGHILGISAGTIKRHVDHILEKLHVETRTAAARAFHESRPAGRFKRQ
jgi:DNA-binding NarL/FixJ family response regulator